jgi:hypothetical protein
MDAATFFAGLGIIVAIAIVIALRAHLRLLEMARVEEIARSSLEAVAIGALFAVACFAVGVA